MGRITVFTVANCTNSLRVKHALEIRNMPYVEISISAHPQKRSDMFRLCGRYSVPQVFFNTRHVGGVREITKLLKEWDETPNRTAFDRYTFEIGSRADPTNPFLCPPSSSSSQAEQQLEIAQEEIIVLPNGEKASYRQITETLKAMLPMQDIQNHNATYKNCFSGQAVANAIASKYCTISNLKEGDAFCTQLLVEHKLFSPIRFKATRRSSFFGGSTAFQQQQNNNNESFVNTEDFYYRLQCHQTPDILNSYRSHCSAVNTINTISGINAVMVHLFKLMKNIESSITSKCGQINYRVAQSDTKYFPAFEEAACELQKIDITSIDDNATKMAIALNIYNLMLKYAFMKVGIGTCKSSRAALLKTVKFNVGGEIFSFDDWLHGVIRGNRAAYNSKCCSRKKSKEYFSNNDQRKRFILSTSFGDTDDFSNRHISGSYHPSMIHFGILSRFTKSSPPISYFTMKPAKTPTGSKRHSSMCCTAATRLQEELIMVTYAFCENDENVKVSQKERKIVLDDLFHTYAVDFFPNDYVSSSSERRKRLLLSLLCQFLVGTKRMELERLLESTKQIVVSFKDEEANWTHNASAYNSFEMESGTRSLSNDTICSSSSDFHPSREKDKTLRGKNTMRTRSLEELPIKKSRFDPRSLFRKSSKAAEEFEDELTEQDMTMTNSQRLDSDFVSVLSSEKSILGTSSKNNNLLDPEIKRTSPSSLDRGLEKSTYHMVTGVDDDDESESGGDESFGNDDESQRRTKSESLHHLRRFSTTIRSGRKKRVR